MALRQLRGLNVAVFLNRNYHSVDARGVIRLTSIFINNCTTLCNVVITNSVQVLYSIGKFIYLNLLSQLFGQSNVHNFLQIILSSSWIIILFLKCDSKRIWLVEKLKMVFGYFSLRDLILNPFPFPTKNTLPPRKINVPCVRKAFKQSKVMQDSQFILYL